MFPTSFPSLFSVSFHVVPWLRLIPFFPLAVLCGFVVRKLFTMPAPDGFSWIDKPHVAAMAQPAALDEYRWLREHGIQFVICLTEDPPRRSWINEAGLFSLHIPVEDMQPPSQHQIDLGMAAIDKANANHFAVGVHCTAGLGRTGTLLACWLVHHEGLSARDAITRVRRLRPGSIETDEQSDAVVEFARRRRIQAEADVP